MKKIPTIFVRDFVCNPSLVTDEVNIEARWVFDGEGIATRKYDGTCVLFDGQFHKRHELKPSKVAPPLWVPADEVDPKTGKQQGWLPIGNGPEDKYFREAVNLTHPINAFSFEEGTYELVGPKIQGGIESDFSTHCLVLHKNAETYEDCPRTFNELREWLADKNIEGIVWHHPDGRMAKIKLKDLGLKRKMI